MIQQIELPDFEKIFALIDTIKDVSIQRSKLALEIDFLQDGIVRSIYKESADRGTKPPSMEFIKNTFLISGLDGELKPNKIQLAFLDATLSNAKLELEMYKLVIEVWRTNSANERKSL